MAGPPDISVSRAELIDALALPDPAADHNTSRTFIPPSREIATNFADLILRTANICTRSNIKQCYDLFIINGIAQSQPRRTAVIDYLVTLSVSSGPRDLRQYVDTSGGKLEHEGLAPLAHGTGQMRKPPQPAAKRLHIFYIATHTLSSLYSTTSDPHDLGHFKQRESNLIDALLREWTPKVSTLAELAACRCSKGGADMTPRILHAVERLHGALNMFATNADVFDLSASRERVLRAQHTPWSELLETLSAAGGSSLTTTSESERLRLAEARRPHVPKERHGVVDDPSAPWHELPATNGLYMLRTRGYPLRAAAFPPGGFGMENAGQEYSEPFIAEILTLRAEMLAHYNKFPNPDAVRDIDAMGNVLWKDPARPTRDYWGFAVDGAEVKRAVAKEAERNARGYEDLGFGGVGGGVGVGGAVERARGLAGGGGGGNGFGRGGGGGEGALLLVGAVGEVVGGGVEVLYYESIRLRVLSNRDNQTSYSDPFRTPPLRLSIWRLTFEDVMLQSGHCSLAPL